MPIPDQPHIGLTTYDAKDPDTKFPPIRDVRPPEDAPNVLVVLIDDVGFGASSAFGGPCHTPYAEKLAGIGLKYTRFHTTALCSPTRKALLTGRNHHSVGMGGITEIATAAPGYSSVLSNSKAPLARTLTLNGYSTAQFGKCHEVPVWQTSPKGPFNEWPSAGGGFEYFHGFIRGEDNQWEPALYEGTNPVEPPKTAEEGYHLTEDLVDGRRRILNDPPLLVRFSAMLTEEQKAQITEQDVEKTWQDYVDSLPRERRRLLSRFRISDGALRVGGVGSVGTRCSILLLQGGAEDDALILQQKEAGISVLEPHATKRDYASQAERVVIGQRLMQAASDIFLGWHQSSFSGRQYYWRQLKDMKGSVDVATLDEPGLETYLEVCGMCVARAHARTGDAAGISGYVGKGDTLDTATADFALAYADQTELDYQALVEAVASGRIAAETGV